MYSMPIGIVILALAGVVSTSCGSRGLRAARTDGGASDAAASSGGQPGSTLSQGGSGGTSGGVEAGSTAGTTGAGGSAVPLSSPGAEAGGSAGADAAGDVSRLDGGGAVLDSSVPSDVKVLCGPVCLNYCPDGNLLDENGCEVCGCKPPPDSGPACACGPGTMQNAFGCLTCGYCANGYVLDATGCPTCTCNSPPSVCPGMKCAACPPGYENVRDASGCLTCNCAPVTPCSQILDGIECAARGDCAWLEPGCNYFGTLPLPAAICHDSAGVGCTASNPCPDGQACVQRVINPCSVGVCQACGSVVGICMNL
jgi:Antistasin family